MRSVHSVVSPSPSVHSGLASIARVLLAAPSSPEGYISTGPSSTRWEWTRVAVSLASRSSIWCPRQYRVYRPVFYYYCGVCVCLWAIFIFHFIQCAIYGSHDDYYSIHIVIIINSHHHFAFTFMTFGTFCSCWFNHDHIFRIAYHNHCSPSFNRNRDRNHNYDKKNILPPRESVNRIQSFHTFDNQYEIISSCMTTHTGCTLTFVTW